MASQDEGHTHEMVSHRITKLPDARSAHCECGEKALPLYSSQNLTAIVLGYACPEHGFLHHSAIIYDEEGEA